MRKVLLVSSALIMCQWSAVAAAQEAPLSDDVEAGSEGLDEIVVSAQRRTESAQKAGIAIDVVGPGDLENAGIVTPTALNAAVPALYVSRAGGGNASFFIRGVGNFTNNAYSDPAIAFNVDGVYFGRPTSTTGTFYDLERIEVLKGPQGTLYGRNATGGAINILSQRPKLGEFSGYLSGSYGNYNSVDIEGAVNAPIGDRGAIRISGKFVDADGYNADGTDQETGRALRGQLYVELTDSLSMRVIADYSKTGGTGPAGSYDGTLSFTPGSAATATSPANFTFVPAPGALGERPGFHTPAADAYHSTFVIGGAFINPAPLDYPKQDTQSWGVTTEISADLGGINLTVNPAYRETKINSLFNGPAFRGGRIRELDTQFSIEARLTGTVGAVDWLLGGFHFNEDIDGAAGYNQYFVQSLQNFKTGTTSNAVFGRLNVNVADNFRLIGAARYTDDGKYFNGGANTVVQICTRVPPPAGPGCFGGPSLPTATSLRELQSLIPVALLPAGFPPAPGPANARPFGSAGNLIFYAPTTINQPISNNRVTYRLAAEYDAGPTSLIYASYETGYRSGGYSVSFGRETYQPEYLNAVTVGAKNRFLDNRLQVNLEGFYWKYRNQQISHAGFDALGGSSYFTENVGRSRIMGVDVDVQYKVTPTTTLSGSVQYLDSKLSDFVYNMPRAATSLPPAVGCPYTPGTQVIGSTTFPVYLINCSGNPGFNSPKWSINGGLEQRFELGDYSLTFNASGRYRSSRVTGFEYLAQQYSGSDFVADASLAFAPVSEKWVLTAWVLNITDTTVSGTTQFLSAPGNVISTSYAPPRTYGIRARVNF